jgi:hypothetical protein
MRRISPQNTKESLDDGVCKLYQEIKETLGYIPEAYRFFGLQKNILEAN